MLQQNWALIEDEVAGAVRVYFISDTSGVFDEIAFPSASSANEALKLKLNGFRRFADSPDLQSFLRPNRALSPIYPSQWADLFFGALLAIVSNIAAVFSPRHCLAVECTPADCLGARRDGEARPGSV